MSTVKLTFEKVAAKASVTKTPWIFLHGMMGCKRNYRSLSKNKVIS